MSQSIKRRGHSSHVGKGLDKGSIGDAANNHVGVEHVKEAKVQGLKSEFETIRKKNGESIDDFSMKLTMIVSDIRLVEEISIVKKFLRAVPPRFM